jgi:hypothetical protein
MIAHILEHVGIVALLCLAFILTEAWIYIRFADDSEDENDQR